MGTTQRWNTDDTVARWLPAGTVLRLRDAAALSGAEPAQAAFRALFSAKSSSTTSLSASR